MSRRTAAAKARRAKSFMSQQDRDNLDAVTIRNWESPLLRMPGEIRNKIYGYIFDDDIDAARNLSEDNIEAPTRVSKGKRPDWRGLSQSCRLLRHETAILPFVLGTLVFNSIQDFKNLITNLTTAQCHAITKAKFLFWDNIPDVRGTTVGLNKKDRLVARGTQSTPGTEQPLLPYQEAKRAKNAAKRARKAEEMAKKKYSEDQNLLTQSPATPAQELDLEAGKISDNGITYYVPRLTQVQIGAMYHEPEFFDPEKWQVAWTRSSMIESMDCEFSDKCRETFDQWLRTGAADKIEVVHLEPDWNVEDTVDVYDHPLRQYYERVNLGMGISRLGGRGVDRMRIVRPKGL